MKYRLIPVLFLGLVLQPALPAPAAVLTGHATLIAAPFEAHPGGQLYLSGGGFPARERLHVVLGCPNFNHVAARFASVTTDSHGRFVALRLTVPRTIRPAGPCALYAGHGPATRPEAAPAPLLVIPVRGRLQTCATRICVHVRATLVRLRTQTEGNIVVIGWPGALARVTVAGPNGSRVTHTIHLGWRGNGLVRLRVSRGLKKGAAKQVEVRVHLGRFSGSAVTGFGILPIGR